MALHPLPPLLALLALLSAAPARPAASPGGGPSNRLSLSLFTNAAPGGPGRMGGAEILAGFGSGDWWLETLVSAASGDPGAFGSGPGSPAGPAGAAVPGGAFPGGAGGSFDLVQAGLGASLGGVLLAGGPGSRGLRDRASAFLTWAIYRDGRGEGGRHGGGLRADYAVHRRWTGALDLALRLSYNLSPVDRSPRSPREPAPERPLVLGWVALGAGLSWAF